MFGAGCEGGLSIAPSQKGSECRSGVFRPERPGEPSPGGNPGIACGCERDPINPGLPPGLGSPGLTGRMPNSDPFLRPVRSLLRGECGANAPKMRWGKSPQSVYLQEIKENDRRCSAPAARVDSENGEFRGRICDSPESRTRRSNTLPANCGCPWSGCRLCKTVGFEFPPSGLVEPLGSWPRDRRPPILMRDCGHGQMIELMREPIVKERGAFEGSISKGNRILGPGFRGEPGVDGRGSPGGEEPSAERQVTISRFSG
ncbi:hypothetical protein BH23PLA1_BH23PLA1_26280 [soil metagenome]